MPCFKAFSERVSWLRVAKQRQRLAHALDSTPWQCLVDVAHVAPWYHGEWLDLSHLYNQRLRVNEALL